MTGVGILWLAAALMSAVALWLVAPPMLGRRRRDRQDRELQNVAIARERLAELEADHAGGILDDDEFAEARKELELSLADDLEGGGREAGRSSVSPFAAVAVIALVPIAASGLYLLLGSPGSLMGDGAPARTTAGTPPAAPAPARSGDSLPSVEEMVAGLEQRLAANPTDQQGWFMLARSYMIMRRFEDAVRAFQQLLPLTGESAEVLVRYADALAMSRGGRISGEPAALLERALALDPDQPQGLWLSGMGAAERGDHRTAIATWERLLPMVQSEPDSFAEVRQLIARSRQALGEDPDTVALAPEPSTPAAQTMPAGGGASIDVRVELDDALAARVQPNDVLFVFARASAGPPMPLAVVRQSARSLPLEVTLNDSMAMMPTLKLSNFDEIRVSARISRSGNATAQSGDLSGEVGPISLADAGTVLVRIADIVP